MSGVARPAGTGSLPAAGEYRVLLAAKHELAKAAAYHEEQREAPR